ncbi:MAG: hypothetical protein ACYC7E_20415 [Armatimonadota bacterium]
MSTAPRKRPAILSDSSVHAEWLAQPLLDAGFNLCRCPLEEVPARLASGQYNVLLLGRYYTLRHTKQQEDALLAELATALRDFMTKGGGVLFALPSGGVLTYDELLAPYGVQILTLGVRQEEQSIIEGSDIDPIIYAYTTAVSPVIGECIDGIWYPAMMGHGLATRPVHTRAEDGWQVFLAGTESSHTDRKHVGGGNSIVDPDEMVPDYPQSVPLLAGRQVGAGRLAVCGIPSGYNIDSPHNFPLGKQFLSDGFQGTPSGMAQVLVNLAGWLAAPSAESGVLGGAPSDADALLPQAPKYPADPPVQWAARDFPPDDPRPRRGLVGARTQYSCGRGTVAEYVARAKAAGLDFIVFLEAFPAINEEGWQALKAECEAHTTDDFLAVPGYTLDDCANVHWFQYGYTIELPKADMLSKDGSMLATAGPDEPRYSSRNNRMDGMHLNYLFLDLQARCRRGRYLQGDTQTLFIDQRSCDSIALVTWKDGEILEDVRDRYRRLEDQHLRLNPVVLTLMDGPEDVARAVASGWRTVLIEPYDTLPQDVLRKWMAPELEWWGMIDEEYTRAPRFRFDNWQYGHPFQYMTSGPEVQAWTASVTVRDASWRAPDTEIPPTGDWFRVDVTHFRLRIKVSSAVGLAEVRLYDGDRIIRRWQPDGAGVFEQEIDLMHHQQMQLGLDATDVNGGCAVCMAFNTLRLDWCEFYCADRNNPLMIGFEKDERGLAYGWSGTIYLTYNSGPWGGTCMYLGRWWYGGDNIYPVPPDPLADEIYPGDGGVRTAGAGLHVYTQLPQLDPPEFGLDIVTRPEMISTDVAIDSFTVDHGFDFNWPFFFGNEVTGFGNFPAHPTRYIEVRRLARVFRPRPQGLTALQYEYDIRFKQDPKLREPLRAGWLDAASKHVLIRRDGTRVEMAGQDEQEFRAPWRNGECIVSWTEGKRPAIFINDGADLELIRAVDWPAGKRGPTNDQHGLLAFYLPVEALPAVGKSARMAFYAIGGGHGHTDPDIAETLYAAMGLAGDPAYTVEMEAGTIRSQRLTLALDGAGLGAACRIPRADLPMALPISVSGLNQNWPVFFVDRTGARWRPLGLHAPTNTAYAVLDTVAQDWLCFLGHPLTASNPDLVLNLAQIGDAEWALEVHNPTGSAITATIAPSPYFTLLDWAGEEMTLAAGASRVLQLQSATAVKM